jgi:hypothetical protein
MPAVDPVTSAVFPSSLRSIAPSKELWLSLMLNNHQMIRVCRFPFGPYQRKLLVRERFQGRFSSQSCPFVLYRPRDIMFEFLSCAKRPVGIAQKFTGQENEVSLTVRMM